MKVTALPLDRLNQAETLPVNVEVERNRSTAVGLSRNYTIQNHHQKQI